MAFEIVETELVNDGAAPGLFRCPVLAALMNQSCVSAA